MATSNFLAEFTKKFKAEEYLIKDYKFWRWSLRPVQCTLGASVLSLKRYAPAFSDIATPQAGELALVASELERVLTKTFAYQKINYLMLMLVDPHVHFHVVPRYAEAKRFAARDWLDGQWPKPPDLGGEEVEAPVAALLINAIKKNL